MRLCIRFFAVTLLFILMVLHFFCSAPTDPLSDYNNVDFEILVNSSVLELGKLIPITGTVRLPNLVDSIEVDFDDSTSMTIRDLKDEASSLINMDHTYLQPGDYTISVKVFIKNKRTKTVITKITITGIKPLVRIAGDSLINLTEGEDISLLTTVIGTNPISYKWLKNGDSISPNKNFVMNMITISDSGSYSCMVSNQWGLSISNSVIINITKKITPHGVDSIPPNPPIVTSIALTNDTTPLWSWVSGGGGSGVFRTRVDLDSFTESWPTQTSFSLRPKIKLGEGQHVLYVQEKDSAGNWSSSGHSEIILDLTPPSPPLVLASTPTRELQPIWSWSATGGGKGNYRVQIDKSIFDTNCIITQNTTFKPTANLTIGKHVLYVEEQDNANNWSTPGSFEVEIDTTIQAAPNVTGITPTNSTTPKWAWKSAGGTGEYIYKLDSKDFSSGTATTKDSTFTPVTALTEGSHILYVSEKSLTGINSAQGLFVITIDITPPQMPLVSGSFTITSNTKPTWFWKSVGADKYRIKLDTNQFSSTSKTTIDTQFTPPTGLNEGTHTLFVQACDNIGNWSNSGFFSYYIDNTPPRQPVVTCPPFSNKLKPTWTWSSGGNGAGIFRCKIDTNNLLGAQLITSLTFTPANDLTEGTHTLYVQEKDSAGNWSQSGTAELKIDITPPSPPIVSSLTPTKLTKPEWNWQSGGGGNGQYRFRIDEGNYSSPLPINKMSPSIDLAEGKHTLFVQESDSAGNWSRDGLFEVQILTTPPGAPKVTVVSLTSNLLPTWSWTGLSANGTYRYKLNSEDFSTGSIETTAASFTPSANLIEGVHTLYVQEKDIAGNWSQTGFARVTIDITSPNRPILDSPTITNNGRPTWNWTSGGGNGNNSFRFKLDDNAFSVTDVVSTTRSFQPTTNLTEGTHTLYVQESDDAGNWSISGTSVVIIDKTPPSSPLITVSSPSKNLRPVWSWTSSGTGGNGTFRVKLDNGAYSSPSPSTTFTPSTDLNEGSHTLYVDESDNAGNWSLSALGTANIDITPPGIPNVIISSPTNNPQPNWNWSSSGGGNGSYRYKIDDSNLGVGATVTTSLSSKPPTNLTEGNHTLFVQESDIAGNWSPSGSAEVLIDFTAPNSPSVNVTTPTKSLRPTWTWTSGGGGSGTFRYKLDNGNYSSASTVTTYTPSSDLTEGSHTLNVDEKDASGNWSSSGTSVVVIDITPPSVPSISVSSPTNNQQPTWNWSSSGNGIGSYRIKLDNNDLVNGSTSTAAISYKPSSNLSEGPHTLYIQEVDQVGNWSPIGYAIVTIDISSPNAPIVTSSSQNTQNLRPTWTWTSGGNGGNGTFRAKIGDENFSTGNIINLTTTSYTPASNLSEGVQTLYVQERDAVGNWSISGSYAITIAIDRTPPNAPIVSGPTITSNNRPTWTWTSGGNGGTGNYRYSLTNDFTTGGTATTNTTFTPNWDLADGNQTLYVQEKSANNVWSSSGSFKVICQLNLIFVNQNATGAIDGKTWKTAYRDLHSALTVAANKEVWVAKGTYYPSGARGSFALPNNSKLRGGFAGNENETSISNRDWANNLVTLSGELGASGSTDNSYHVIKLDGTSGGLIECMIIIDGYADGGMSPDNSGAGIYANNLTGDLTLKRCILKNNTVTNNSAPGSVVYWNSNTILNIDDCVVYDNPHGASTQPGSIIEIANGYLNSTNTVYSNTTVASTFKLINMSGTANFTNCSFSRYMSLSGTIKEIVESYTPTQFKNCILFDSNNKAATSGAAPRSISFTNCLVSDWGTISTQYWVSPGSGNFEETNPFNNQSLPSIASYWFTNNSPYLLKSTSKAINGGTSSGSPLTDIRGITRPQGGAVDIGAYEQ